MQFIKILVEFDLYISTIRFKESSIPHTQCTSVMFIFRSLSPKTDVHTAQVSYRFLALGCFPANLVSDVVCVLFVLRVGSLKG